MKHLLILIFLLCVIQIMGSSPVTIDNSEENKKQTSFDVFDLQMDYSKNGVLIGKKIDFLKNSCIESEGHLFAYTNFVRLHDNRIISAVIEKRNKYIFFNATQSDDKLWAYKHGLQGWDAKRVLIIYDINDPSMFGVVNWDPSEEEYDYYNTKDGQVSNEKYLRWIKFLPYSSNIESPIFYESHIYKTHSQKTPSH